MHSSRMRTGRSLTVFRSLQPGGCVPGPGVPGPGGVYLVRGGTWSRGGVPGARGGYLVPGGCTWSRGGVGVYLVWGGVPGQVPPPVNRMTNRCKNITLAKTSFRPVMKQTLMPMSEQISSSKSF